MARVKMGSLFWAAEQQQQQIVYGCCKVFFVELLMVTKYRDSSFVVKVPH